MPGTSPVTHSELDRSGDSPMTDAAHPTGHTVPQLRGLPGGDAQRPGMRPAVMLGQDLAEAAGAVGDRALADLAACDPKVSNGDGVAAGL
jgi:hypothetical protein